jgi:hypothetical protein
MQHAIKTPEDAARCRYNERVAALEGHKCPAWEALPDLMRQLLINLAAQTNHKPET